MSPKCEWTNMDATSSAYAEGEEVPQHEWCERMATTISCVPCVGNLTCDLHKCRCAKPIEPPAAPVACLPNRSGFAHCNGYGCDEDECNCECGPCWFTQGYEAGQVEGHAAGRASLEAGEPPEGSRLWRCEKELEKARAALAEVTATKDGAYDERNRVVAALAWLAIKLGYRAGINAHEGPEDFGDWKHVCKIQLPVGQCSWHFTDAQAEYFVGLPHDDKPWDGHTTPEKYERLAKVRWIDVNEKTGGRAR